MKKIQELVKGSKKKAAVVTLAGAIVVGSVGGSAFAWKDEWAAKINKGIDMLAGYIYKDDVQKAVDSHGNSLEAKIRTDIQNMIAAVTADLQAHKQNEINRGKKSLDDKYADDKARAQNAVNAAVANEKSEQEAKTNTEIQNEKNDMDAVIEAELAKVPN